MVHTLVLLVILLSALPAWSATKYVDATAGACTGNYSIAARDCSGTDGNSYATADAGLDSLSASDILYFRAGTYNMGGTVRGNTAADKWGGGATSWATATQIKNYPGEAVVIQTAGWNLDNTIATGGVSYIIIEGDSRANFIIERSSGSGTGIRVANGSNHVRIKTLTVRNFLEMGISAGGTVSSFIEIIDNEIRNNGDNTTQEHGIYPNISADWLVERNYVVGNQAYGIHFYSATANNHMRATIRYNVIEGRKSTGTGTAFCVIVRTGSGHKVHNNLCIGLGGQSVKYTGGFHIGGTGTEVYNNTVYDVTGQGVEIHSSSSGALIKNNIFDDTPTSINDLGSGTIKAYNLCDAAACDTTGATNTIVTATPGFVTPGSDFTLAAGSAAIDAGLSTVCTAYNGTSCDQGAYETFVVAACSVEAATPTIINITFTNNVNPPLLPASGVTGITARADTIAKVMSGTGTRIGDNQIDQAVTVAFIAGQAIDITIAASNLTDSALIGGTLNQPFVQTVANVSCTNNTAGVPSHSFRQKSFKAFGLRGSESAPVATPYADAPENTNILVMPNGKFRLRIALECEAGTNCPATGFYPFYSCPLCTSAGTYTQVPDTYAAGEYVGFCGTSPDPDIPTNGTTTATELLTAAGTFDATGAIVRTSNAIPTLTMTAAHKVELEYCLSVQSTVPTSPPNAYTIELRKQDGSQLEAYTVRPVFTATPSSAGMGF